jgi:hypothetical protein
LVKTFNATTAIVSRISASVRPAPAGGGKVTGLQARVALAAAA